MQKKAPPARHTPPIMASRPMLHRPGSSITHVISRPTHSISHRAKRGPPTFNMLIATIGRSTLKNMIDSLKPELTEADCLTVVYDGRKCYDRSIYDGIRCKVNIHEEPVALGHWGHGIRNKYAPLLERRDFIMHADDDDIYAAGCFSRLRQLIHDASALYIARMSFIEGEKTRIMPEGNIIKMGNIGTPCGIIPYELNKQGSWLPIFGGDGKFYEQLEAIQKRTRKNVMFLDELIYIIRPRTIVAEPVINIDSITPRATNTNVFMYWDKGEIRMPPMLRRIYMHNKAICKKFNLNLHLITDDNIHTYITVPDRFWSLAPNFKSDICRFYLLDKFGGVWLDTDIIITKDLNKLVDFLKNNNKQMMLDMEFEPNIGCASIVALPHTACTAYCRDHVENFLTTKSELSWEDIGPTNVRECVKTLGYNIWINSGEITKKGCNFIDWREDPGINKSHWYYPTSDEAYAVASKIFREPIAYYAVTWTIYRINDMVDTVGQVLDDPRSIFHHLITLANAQ